MAYRRQPYGDWRDQGRRGADNNNYEDPYQRQRGVYDRYATQQQAVHADDQAPNQQTKPHDRHLSNQRAVEAHQPSGQQAGYSRQPTNQPSERKKNNNYDRDDDRGNNNNDDDDDDNNNNDETEEKDEETISVQAKPNAPTAAAPSANRYGGGYETTYNRPDYNSNNRYSDYRNNDRTTQGNRWANRDGYSAGYGRNAATATATAVVAGDDDNDAEQIRNDFANRFTLSPRRQHVLEKKPGEASHGQPNVTVVKELKLYLEHNKIENFAFKKRERGKGKK